MGRYRFALRPRWLLSHVLVAVLVVVMVNLGFWQLRRLDQKRDYNALVRERQQAPVADIADVVDAGAGFDDAGDVTYRRVSATGTYDVNNEILVRSRSLKGRPGVWVLTPLVTDDGTALIVNRGFVEDSGVPDGVSAEAEPTTDEVRAEGLLQPTQTKGRFGASDPAGGRLVDIARVDLARIQQQIPYDLYPVFLQLDDQDPAPGDEPELLPPPELDEGSHLGYAVQWFAFSAIAFVGYPLILRRQAREPDEDDDAEPVSDEPVVVA